MFKEFRQVVQSVCPTDAINRPTFIGGCVRFRIIESAGVQFEPIGDGWIIKLERASAVAAESTLAICIDDRLWSSLSPDEGGTAPEERPCNEWGSAGFATVGAMTNRGLYGQ